jgi:hydroxypyruvate reductase
MADDDLAGLAREIFAAALTAAEPGAFTKSALARCLPTDGLQAFRKHWILAVGKAAPAMAQAATQYAESNRLRIAGGLIVAPTRVSTPDALLDMLAGDHPIPGERSLAAADRLAYWCEQMAPDDLVLVLISGGTSALIGAPVDGVTVDDLAALSELLLASGIEIERTNAVRKRFARWGAGRLAAALAPSPVQPILLSDVPGDDPAAIGSGPVSPDSYSAEEIENILRDAGIAHRLPLRIAAMLGAMRSGDLPETPKPGSSIFHRVRAPMIGGNHSALRAAESAATGSRIKRVVLDVRPLAGDAAEVGRSIARALLAAEPGTCLLMGGETTVHLPDDHGLGGRSQQLALAAAEILGAADAPPTALFAAGTDGRDGPTDAAGAVVTQDSWRALCAAGIDPGAALARCDAHPALDAIGALVRTGLTGTNVGDIVIALRG